MIIWRPLCRAGKQQISLVRLKGKVTHKQNETAVGFRDAALVEMLQDSFVNQDCPVSPNLIDIQQFIK